MANDVLQHKLSLILGSERVLTDEPMERHCSFRVGGPAGYYLRVENAEELQKVLRVLEEAEEPYFILGKGTNLLVGDRGYRGAVITLTGAGSRPVTDTSRELAEDDRLEAKFSDTDSVDSRGSEQPTGGKALRGDGRAEEHKALEQTLPDLHSICVEGNRIIAGAGASLAACALAARDRGLSGLEFAAGIPGSVGGGLVMNAGAYGGEMKDVVEKATLLMPDGKVLTWPKEDLRFGYRRSVLKELPAVALEAVLVLQPDDSGAISGRMADFAARRKDKQPLEYPSAGSTFKRPEGHFAGKLIEDAGLRGYTVGGACVSAKHCGFVINKDHATAADIRQVIADVQQKVFATSGVKLEPEVIFLGEF